jgi:hypothetical protein
MQLLQDVRRLFRRRHQPVEIDLDGTQAERLAMAMSASRTEVEEDSSAIEVGTGHDCSEDQSTAEAASLVRSISEHLQGQTERTERLLSLLDRVPQALDALPEIGRLNAGVLEALHDHLAQGKRRDETLSATLIRMSESTERQAEVLGLIQQQIDASRASTERLTEPLGELRSALEGLSKSNQQATEVLKSMWGAADRREIALTQALTHTQRWLIGAVILCAVASAAAGLTGILTLAR